MRSKIFRSILLSLLATLTVSLGVTIALVYSHFTNEQLDQLRNETNLVSQAVTLNGQDYFDRLGPTDFRITWITSDGTILYDNEADSKVMENLRTRIKTCEQAMNDNDFLILRKSTSMLKKEMD